MNAIDAQRNERIPRVRGEVECRIADFGVRNFRFGAGIQRLVINGILELYKVQP